MEKRKQAILRVLEESPYTESLLRNWREELADAISRALIVEDSIEKNRELLEKLAKPKSVMAFIREDSEK